MLMPIPIPMLSDFSVRLACGLAAFLIATPWRVVPPAFFRTHCQVILGLLVLSALDLSRAGAPGMLVVLAAGAAGMAYFASVAWGLGLSRVGGPLTALIALATVGILVSASRSPEGLVWALNASGRLASAALMGSTLTAMLLGHHYLTAPAMSIDPLRRFVRAMAWSLGIRAALAAPALWIWLNRASTATSGSVSPFFLAVRWGMGFAGPLVATVLTWKTVEIRSTQSATGILYIALTLVLFGELTALILSRGEGIMF
jgi:hypothetical protein